ncbi:MAG: hypothetical protein EB153_09340, partial [Nitrosopumilaceae archaeon]|nr:hypothetical protein [Nitrosopumilaceae archaeon]
AYDPTWKGILNSKQPQKNPYVFIFGASYAYPINSTHVAEYLEKNNLNYDVYNLADMSDTPTHRIKNLEHIISLKPKVVLYCVSITDFAKSVHTELKDQKKDELADTLSLKQGITKIISSITSSNTIGTWPTSPKERTILSLKYAIRGPEYPHNPFINFNTIPITDEKTFASKYKVEFGGVDTSPQNKQRIALEKIISELKKNNIKVILFTSPHHRVFIDGVGSSGIETFESLMRDISDENDVDVYFLHDKYKDMNIWRDPHHIAVNTKSIIYSDDIGDILAKELKQ